MIAQDIYRMAVFVSALIVVPLGHGHQLQVTVASAEQPFVSQPVTPIVVTLDLRTLPTVPPWAPGDPIIEFPDAIGEEGEGLSRRAERALAGTAPQALSGSGSATTPILTPPTQSFNGIFSSGAPPDTNGDVSPTLKSEPPICNL